MRALAALGLTAIVAITSHAQGPAGADALTPAAVIDSQRVLDDLGARVRTNANDAAAWYRRGMIAWALADRARAANPPRELDAQRLGRLADTSLRIAAQIDRTKALYSMMAGRYLLASGVAITRSASYDFFKSAVEAARRGSDPNMLAETAVDYGRVFWRRYDAVAYRRHATQPGADIRSIVETLVPACVYSSTAPCAKRPMRYIREAITTQTVPLPTEGADMAVAEGLFREAYNAAPTNPRAVRHVAMIFAERSDWRGLEQFAKAHLAQVPWDAWGWLSLGLASQRLGNVGAASAAFDSATALLDHGERGRLDRLDRVLPSHDSSRAVRGTDAERAAYQRLYWAMSDPVWSRNGNGSHTEYLARVTFAELRWTVDELRVRGADTDRGDIFIRYGPPEIVASFAPSVGSTSDSDDGSSSTTSAANVSTVWVYGTELAFVFVGAPTFATARTPPADVHLADQLTQAQPVRFDNIPRPTVDSMATQIARFRGGHDSVDVLLAANLPAAAIRASETVAGAVQGDVWFMNGSATITYHDSTNLTADGIRTWQHRVAPGAYLYRVQASADAATRAARSTGVIDAATVTADPFAIHGTAISDVLLASSATPRGGTAGRWQDFDFTPIVGGVARGGSLSVVWENYEFGARGNNAEYTVAVTLVQQKGTLGKIAASVLGSLASVARINHGDDRATITFERTVPHAPAVADLVSIGLNETPSGNYLLTLQITDRVTGKVMTRTRPLIIRD